MIDPIDHHSYTSIKQTSRLKELFYITFVFNDYVFLCLLEGRKNLGNLYNRKAIFPKKTVA